MRSNIFLTSSVASVADHLYEHHLCDKGLGSVLFIDTAAEDLEGEDLTWLEEDLQSLVRQGYSVERYSVTGQTLGDIEEKLDAHDIVYMCGGNTVYLLNQLQKTNALVAIRDHIMGGKVYIGTSAGSIVAGPSIPLYLREGRPELASYEGLGFTTVVTVPHWGSPHFKEEYLGTRLEQAYRKDQPPFLLLSDNQYAVVDGEGGVRVATVER